MIADVTEQISEILYEDRIARASCQIKSIPEDFIVEELPLYPCSGTGEHCYLFVEKRQYSTGQLIAHLSKVLGLAAREIGYAGKKDADAVSRQWISIPWRFAEKLKAEESAFQILKMERHQNKLRLGHLLANRFQIRLRNISGIDLSALDQHLKTRAHSGFWNCFGPQRFGERGRSLNLALKWIDGGCRPKRDRRTSPDFMAAVWQAGVFNWSAILRKQAGMGMDLVEGDIAEYAVRRQYALGSDLAPTRDVKVPTGPMWGGKMRLAEGRVLHYEQLAFEQWSSAANTLELFERWAPGTRRPFVAFADDYTFSAEGDTSALVTFVLTPGCYATTFLSSVLRVSDANHLKEASSLGVMDSCK